MKRESAIELRKAAEELADFHNRPERKEMFTGEEWAVFDIYPFSDMAACVAYVKSGGKKAAAFFFYDGQFGKKKWKHFFPSDAHILGMEAFAKYKFQIEQENFGFNFTP